MEELSKNKDNCPLSLTSLSDAELKEALRYVSAKKKETQDLLSAYSQKENEIRIEIFTRETGLQIGAKVTLKGKAGVISRFIPSYDSVYPVIKYLKKDGTLGEKETKLYSWDMKELHIIS